MLRKILSTIALEALRWLSCSARPGRRKHRTPKHLIRSMAPLDQYLMERNAEIALAQSAAPESISRDAEVMVLGRHGYETAVKGKNGFVCMVQRSWTAGIDYPHFWNPKLRGPRSASIRPLPEPTFHSLSRGPSWYWPENLNAQIFDGIKAAFDKKELPALEPGAMCYMMSKQSYLGDP